VGSGGERKGGRGGKDGRGRRGETTQTLYAHMNKRNFLNRKKKKRSHSKVRKKTPQT
jgi:hypothetical protein